MTVTGRATRDEVAARKEDLRRTVEQVNALLDRPAATVSIRDRYGRGSRLTLQGPRTGRGEVQLKIGRATLAGPGPAWAVERWKAVVRMVLLAHSRPGSRVLPRVLRLLGLALVMFPLLARLVEVTIPASTVGQLAQAIVYGFGSTGTIVLVGGTAVVLGECLDRFWRWEETAAAERQATRWGFPVPEPVRAGSISGTAETPRPFGIALLVVGIAAGAIAGWYLIDLYAAVAIALTGLDPSAAYLPAGPRATLRFLLLYAGATIAELLIRSLWSLATRIRRRPQH